MQAPNFDKVKDIKYPVLDRDTECVLEDLLEELYWEFDVDSSKFPENERIYFKGKLRYYASQYLRIVCERTGISSII